MKKTSIQTDDKLRDKLIDDVCRMLNIHLSHWDHCQYTDNPNARGTPLKVPTCATVYSEKQGHWQIMILQDMSIIRPMDDAIDDIRGIVERISKMLGHEDDLKRLETERKQKERLYKQVQRHLVENDGIRLFVSKFNPKAVKPAKAAKPKKIVMNAVVEKTSKAMLAELRSTFNRFGTYDFDDKGPHEVMDTDKMISKLNAMSLEDAADTLTAVHLGRKDGRSGDLVKALADEVHEGKVLKLLRKAGIKA